MTPRYQEWRAIWAEQRQVELAEVGIAEDKAEASIACRQIGPIKLPLNLQTGESVFSKKRLLYLKLFR